MFPGGGYIQIKSHSTSKTHPDWAGAHIIINFRPWPLLQVKKRTPNAKLQCIANGTPLYQLETVWRKDGVPIEATGVPHQLNDLWNRTLSLVSIGEQHAGVYTCEVSCLGNES